MRHDVSVLEHAYVRRKFTSTYELADGRSRGKPQPPQATTCKPAHRPNLNHHRPTSPQPQPQNRKPAHRPSDEDDGDKYPTDSTIQSHHHRLHRPSFTTHDVGEGPLRLNLRPADAGCSCSRGAVATKCSGTCRSSADPPFPGDDRH